MFKKLHSNFNQMFVASCMHYDIIDLFAYLDRANSRHRCGGSSPGKRSRPKGFLFQQWFVPV
jgi:hypothetical protein